MRSTTATSTSTTTCATALPRPGGMEQLKRLSARIMSHQLDRARPLWEMWIIEGLEGDRFAMISKMHHCMLDGEAEPTSPRS